MAKSAKAAILGSMVECKGPELVKFEKRGDSLEGVLLSVIGRTITDKDSNREKDVQIAQLLEVNDELKPTGKEFEFILSADMVSRVRATDAGKYVRLMYSGDERVKNGVMRKFEIRKTQEPVPGFGPVVNLDAEPNF